MDKNKIACLSQKQIKAIKRDCVENGTIERGFFWSILDTQPASELIGLVRDLAEQGIDIARQSESNLQIMVVDELIKQSSYQEFKNELLPHLMG